MHAAAASELYPHDRVSGWYDEVKRLASEVPSLPPAACRAVGTVLASLRHEADTELTVVQRRDLDTILASLSEQT